MGAVVAELCSGRYASGAAGETAEGTGFVGTGAGAETAVGPWIWPSLIWEMALSVLARVVVANASTRMKARAMVGVLDRI